MKVWSRAPVRWPPLPPLQGSAPHVHARTLGTVHLGRGRAWVGAMPGPPLPPLGRSSSQHSKISKGTHSRPRFEMRASVILQTPFGLTSVCKVPNGPGWVFQWPWCELHVKCKHLNTHTYRTQVETQHDNMHKHNAAVWKCMSFLKSDFWRPCGCCML